MFRIGSGRCYVNGAVLSAIGGMFPAPYLPTDSAAFWFMMQIGMLIGFATTVPGELVADPPRHQRHHVTDPPLTTRVPGADAVDDPVDQLIGDDAPL